MYGRFFYGVFLVALLSLLPYTGYPQTTFTNIAKEAGVEELGNTGAAWGDYDNDGDLDLYICNSEGANALFSNNGNGTFTNVAHQAGVEDESGWSVSAAWGDYDNDDDLDLYIVNKGSNVLYCNNGNGTFSDVTSTAGVDCNLTSYFGLWGDYDNDGDLDLYVTNFEVGEPNILYSNNGDGTFTDVTDIAGVDGLPAEKTRGAAWGDYNNDGYPDLYVNNQGSDVLYSNNRDGTFSDVTAAAGIRHRGDGGGCAWGDYDNDDDLDLYVCNISYFSPDSSVLYRNNGDGTFTNVTLAAGLGEGGYNRYCSWADYDNDGDLDLYVQRAGLPGHTKLFSNNGDGTFTNVNVIAGIINDSPKASAVWGDMDSNGFVDLFVSSAYGPNILYRNNGNLNHWLSIRTVGTMSNRNGIGARVKVVSQGYSQIRVVEGGSSGSNCQNSLSVEFGLRNYTQADTVIIMWPSSLKDSLYSVGADHFLTVREGETQELYSMTGKVTDGNTGLGLAKATVGFDGPLSGQVRTDTNGDYRISALVAGQYILWASAKGYRKSPPAIANVPPDTLINFALTAPDIEVSPDSLGVELDQGESITAQLSISNLGSDTLFFNISMVPPNYGTPMLSTQAVSNSDRLTHDLPNDRYPAKFFQVVSSSPESSSSTPPILFSPMSTIIPTIDGNYEEGEWDEAARVVASKIYYFFPSPVGHIFVKNTLDDLYVLIDYSVSNIYTREITGDIWFDLDCDGINDGGFYTELSSDVPKTHFDFPGKVAVGLCRTVTNPNPHWIFEYKIPLSGLGKMPTDVFGIHFVLYNFTWMGGEWYNATDGFDFIYPARWGRISLGYNVPWLAVEPDSGKVWPGEILTINVDFDAEGLTSETHRSLLKIQCNDPDEGEVLIPVELVVDPIVDVNNNKLNSPSAFSISQNYPNPFNMVTKIRYQLPKPSHVSLKIYDLLGREVRTLVDAQKKPGYYNAVWEGRDDRGREVASGVYVFRFMAGDFVGSRKIVVMK